MSDLVLAEVEAFLQRHGTQGVSSSGLGVVAFSGGLDSTVLLHALHALGCRVHAVHVNHQLQESARQWPAHCQAFCDRFNIPFDAVSVCVADHGLGLEAQAREVRYRALYERMVFHRSNTLFCAHHQDDHLETVLLQLFRGSGLRGVAGMRELGPVGVDRHRFPTFQVGRPLLGCRKEDLLNYALRHDLTYVSDPSNTEMNFRRNWVRGELLPSLRLNFPQVDQGLLRLADELRELYSVRDEEGESALARVCDARHFLRVGAWRGLPDALQVDVLRLWLLRFGVRCGRAKLLELHRQLLTSDQGGVRRVTHAWGVRVSKGLAFLDVNGGGRVE